VFAGIEIISAVVGIGFVTAAAASAFFGLGGAIACLEIRFSVFLKNESGWACRPVRYALDGRVARARRLRTLSKPAAAAAVLR
jgi:hypothetical protein